ncbi:MAG: hypothetical protein OXJ90_07515 [Spirochaetaceae bacterium]|nr:hypothetical protein [Spirochaetaceae bacterium]
MGQPEPTLADVLDRIDGLDKKVDQIDKKIDDLADVVERMAEGHNRRFSVIEERLGIQPVGTGRRT